MGNWLKNSNWIKIASLIFMVLSIPDMISLKLEVILACFFLFMTLYVLLEDNPESRKENIVRLVFFLSTLSLVMPGALETMAVSGQAIPTQALLAKSTSVLVVSLYHLMGLVFGMLTPAPDWITKRFFIPKMVLILSLFLILMILRFLVLMDKNFN